MESHSCLKWSNIISSGAFITICGISYITCGALSILRSVLNIIRGGSNIMCGALKCLWTQKLPPIFFLAEDTRTHKNTLYEIWIHSLQYFASYKPSNIAKMHDFVVKLSRGQMVTQGH